VVQVKHLNIGKAY
jgi:hypothetical protein